MWYGSDVGKVIDRLTDSKTCTKCGQLKSLEEFNKSKKIKSGYVSECKRCRTDRVKRALADKKRLDPEGWGLYLEDKRDRSRKWRAENPEASVESVRKWQLANPEKKREINRRYAQRNPEIARNGNRARKARERDAPQFKVTSKFLRKLYSSPCTSCGSVQDIQMDHVVPLKKGGPHSEGNLQPLCQPCNASKQDKYMVYFRKSRGLLKSAKLD